MNNATSYKVPVSTFRDATDHLFAVSRDFHACVNDAERAGWNRCVVATVAVYTGQVCPRATLRDLAQRTDAYHAIRVLTEREIARLAAK